MGKRTISDWVAITKNEKSGWAEFYREMLGSPLSDTPRFLKAVADMGHDTMFDAIVSASIRKLDGDPLNYVLAIAIAKVKEEVQNITSDDRYRLKLEKSKQRVSLQNEELEAKLERARKANGFTK